MKLSRVLADPQLDSDEVVLRVDEVIAWFAGSTARTDEVVSRVYEVTRVLLDRRLGFVKSQLGFMRCSLRLMKYLRGPVKALRGWLDPQLGFAQSYLGFLKSLRAFFSALPGFFAVLSRVDEGSACFVPSTSRKSKAPTRVSEVFQVLRSIFEVL